MGSGNTYAYAINNAGQVTGWGGTSDGATHAFIYSNGTMTDLNDLIDPAAGWLLANGIAINNLGQITGQGEINGTTRAFLLTPISDGAVPEPATWAMLIGGFFLIGGVVRQRGRRKAPTAI